MSQNRHGRHQPAGGNWIYKVDRLAIYLRDGFRCCYCGRDLEGARPDLITLDHLKPLSRLQEKWFHQPRIDEPTNLITACKSCNCSRQNKPWFKYATGGAIEHIKRQRRLSVKRFRVMAKALISGKARNLKCEAARA